MVKASRSGAVWARVSEGVGSGSAWSPLMSSGEAHGETAGSAGVLLHAETMLCVSGHVYHVSDNLRDV